MLQKAAQFMEHVDAQFVVTGEVLGQRPMSQKRRDLDVISRASGLQDRLLRPLSATLLTPTRPEREGLVDRSQLHGFCGRSRKRLIRLARQFGFKQIPPPSTGCALTEPQFANKVRDLIDSDPDNSRWDFELLKTGRHFRMDEQTKIVVGRDEAENDTLAQMHQMPEARSTARLTPENFTGPLVLVVGLAGEQAIRYAGGLILRYCNGYDPDNAKVSVERGDRGEVILARPLATAQQAKTVAVAT
jgi:hypothetical protein